MNWKRIPRLQAERNCNRVPDMQLIPWERAHAFHAVGRGTIVVEFLPEVSELFIWAYQGVDAIPVWKDMAHAARKLGLRFVGCFTYHGAAWRAFRKFHASVFLTGNGEEIRVRIESKELTV